MLDGRHLGEQNRGEEVAPPTLGARGAETGGPGVRTGEKLVREEAPRELVGLRADGPAARLLGRHVESGADDGVVARGPVRDRAVGVERMSFAERVRRRARDPEVHDLHDAVVPNHDVLGLDVAVHEAASVRGRQCSRDLDEPRDAPAQRYPRVSHVTPQRHADDELHRDVRRTFELADVEDGHHVGVIEGGGGARLAHEACAGGGVDDTSCDSLQRDPSPELGIEGAEDLGHPAVAERALHDVPIDSIARRERGHASRYSPATLPAPPPAPPRAGAGATRIGDRPRGKAQRVVRKTAVGA